MRNNILAFFLTLVTLLILPSCERDHLYYASTEMAEVNVVIDWEKAGIKPNGATVYAYTEDGQLYKRFDPFSDPTNGKIQLPLGRYKLVVMNDTPEELSETMTFSGQGLWNSLLASGVKDVTKTAKLMAQTRSDDDYCIKSPDTLAVGRYMDLEIRDDMLQYCYDRPTNGGLFTYERDVVIQPKLVTSTLDIKVHVKGLKYAKGTTMSFLRGSSAGYYMGRDEYATTPVCYGFILNNRTFDEGSSTDGTISASFNIFGMPEWAENETGKCFLDINFVMVNGDENTVSIDVTNQIKADLETQVQVQVKMNLDLDVTLPEAVDQGDDGGGFQTDLNMWEDIIQNIQM